MCNNIDIQAQETLLPENGIISHNNLKDFLTKATFEFKPSQDKVSIPIIERICKRLAAGHTFGPIRVCNGTIVNGHHRYIGLCFLKMDFEAVPGGENIFATTIFDWTDVLPDENDHDTPGIRRYYEILYDENNPTH